MKPEPKRRMLSLLGLAQRAGKLAPGSSRAGGAVKGGKAQGVLICTDLSAKSKKEFRFLCEREDVPFWEPDVTIEDLSAAIGFRAGGCALCDPGFARSVAALTISNGKDDTV
ncbi:MAG: ribosomal L7Ae/L30e/S12e/Gadd45 family protein [Clostridia bacterium]|nr:ribosomal L7Ae/L30e/S12e/Gadd45 family protein [Clostridia bacterium]